jgi:hypothetical protein
MHGLQLNCHRNLRMPEVEVSIARHSSMLQTGDQCDLCPTPNATPLQAQHCMLLLWWPLHANARSATTATDHNTSQLPHVGVSHYKVVLDAKHKCSDCLAGTAMHVQEGYTHNTSRCTTTARRRCKPNQIQVNSAHLGDAAIAPVAPGLGCC